jgi:hypothetical protein
MINEHEITKSMLDTMRLIKESVNTENTIGSTENTGESTESTTAPREILILKKGFCPLLLAL